jgi:phospholipid-binding lipoprotein MlaA
MPLAGNQFHGRFEANDREATGEPFGASKPTSMHSHRRARRSFPAAIAVATVFLLAGAACADDEEQSDGSPTAVAAAPDVVDDVAEDYDPWAPFNERMFTFNHDVLDRFLVRPAATGWDKVMPDPAQRGIGRAFDNLEMPRRLVNNLLQLRPRAAGGELARFLLNTTVGVVGFVDVAKLAFHLEKSDADMGQTFGVYGIGPGPYLVLPFLPPLTVRDGIGRGIDGALDPFGYFIPFIAGTAMNVVSTINERSLNLQLFANVEESILDLYSAVRNGYLQRRQSTIDERLAERRRPGTALTRAGDVTAPARAGEGT